MIKVTKRLFLLMFVGLAFLSTMELRAFDDDSYQRQQSQADKGFDGFDAEFGEAEAVKPPPPKVIIRERIIIQEKRVPTPVAPEPAPATSKPTTRSRMVVSNGYRFDFQSCTLSNRNIECDVIVRTPNVDKTLVLYSYYNINLSSSVFDDQGNQYYPSSIVLGNKDSRPNNNYSITGRLIQGVTTKIKIFFENVSSETTSISMLELHAEDNKKRFKVQFRNISFSS